jgi:DNA polymerase-3 subunit alpha
MYIHLTTHSAYSFLEGLALPAELAQATQADGMPALGLTDTRTLTGSIEFVRACQDADIQPILGLEIDLAGSKLPLLATSMEGWSNLCQIGRASCRERV